MGKRCRAIPAKANRRVRFKSLSTGGAMFLLVAGAAAGQTPLIPRITTSEPITILSANDGWTHARLTGDARLTRDTSGAATSHVVAAATMGAREDLIGVQMVTDPTPNSEGCAPH